MTTLATRVGAALVALLIFVGPVSASEPPFIAEGTCTGAGEFEVAVETYDAATLVTIAGADILPDTYESQVGFWGEGTYGFIWGSDTTTYPGWVEFSSGEYFLKLDVTGCGQLPNSPPDEQIQPVIMAPPPLLTPPPTSTEPAETPITLFALTLLLIVSATAAYELWERRLRDPIRRK